MVIFGKVTCNTEAFPAVFIRWRENGDGWRGEGDGWERRRFPAGAGQASSRFNVQGSRFKVSRTCGIQKFAS